MERTMLAHAYKPLLLAALLALGAIACSDSDDGGSEATQPPDGSQATQPPEPAIGTGAPVANVSMGAATVTPGGDVTVDLIVTPQAGTTVGALDIDVVYDQTVVKMTACTPEGCNATFGVDTVHFSLASLSGYSGVAGSVTFSAIGAEGATSPLKVLLQTCANVEAEYIACSATDGSVTIGPP
jgi:hypothetical protein